MDNPPINWKQKLKLIGPGLVWTAAAIGSGETIIATKVGAEYGYLLIWALWVGLFVKYWIQKGILEVTVLSGKPIVELWHKTKLGKWISAFWLLFYLSVTIGISGLIVLMASSVNVLFPILNLQIVGTIIILSIIVLSYFQNYDVFEKVMLILAGILTIGTIGIVILSKPDANQIFVWGVPATAAGWALLISLVGWGAGSGAELMLPYSWWVSEKGYHGFIVKSKKEENKSLVSKIKKWINVANWDNIIGYILTGIIASCFIIAGAAILHPKGIVIGESQVIQTVYTIFASQYGAWALWIFVISIFAAIYSTALGFIDGARIVIATLIRLLFNKENLPLSQIRKDNWYRMSLLCFALLPLFIFYGVKQPIIMVMIGSITSALSMPILGGLVVYSLYKQIPKEHRPNKFYLFNLILGIVLYIALGIYSLIGLIK